MILPDWWWSSYTVRCVCILDVFAIPWVAAPSLQEAAKLHPQQIQNASGVFFGMGLKPSTFQLWGLNANHCKKKRLLFQIQFLQLGFSCRLVTSVGRRLSWWPQTEATRSLFLRCLSRVRLGIFILDSAKDHTACRQDSKPEGLLLTGLGVSAREVSAPPPLPPPPPPPSVFN